MESSAARLSCVSVGSVFQNTTSVGRKATVQRTKSLRETACHNIITIPVFQGKKAADITLVARLLHPRGPNTFAMKWILESNSNSTAAA